MNTAELEDEIKRLKEELEQVKKENTTMKYAIYVCNKVAFELK